MMVAVQRTLPIGVGAGVGFRQSAILAAVKNNRQSLVDDYLVARFIQIEG